LFSDHLFKEIYVHFYHAAIALALLPYLFINQAPVPAIDVAVNPKVPVKSN